MKPNPNPGVDRTASNAVWSRRVFLRSGGMAALALAQSEAWAVSNGFLSPFLTFDREIQEFMSARKVPGGALAVVKDGRLVYTRGYGWADRENKIPLKPASLSLAVWRVLPGIDGCPRGLDCVGG